MSLSYSHYWIRLSVSDLGSIKVRIRNTGTGKEIFDDNSYAFERLFEVYQHCKDDLLKVPELKKLVERS